MGTAVADNVVEVLEHLKCGMSVDGCAVCTASQAKNVL